MSHSPRIAALLALSLALAVPSTPAFAQTDAKECVKITRDNNGGRPFQVLTNGCTQKIGINYCHESSGMPGTKGTECGDKGRYYQQFTTLEPGHSTGNPYSTPGDARVHFGACVGGEGKIRQTQDGRYNCKP
jgi:hypothetical protein